MKCIFSFLLIICSHVLVNAQTPNKFNYQAVARNSNGQTLINTNLSVRISILDGGATGTDVYSETRNITTNQLGLFTIGIGSTGAQNTTGNFATINWSTGNKFIRVEIDPMGGSNFSVIGNTELLSVPYSLYAVNGTPGVPGPQGPAGPVGPAGPQGQAGNTNINGTANNLVKFTGASTGGNSVITDNGTTIGLGPNLSVTNSTGSITAANGTSPVINMFSSGTTNADRMIIAHSPAFPGWGLQYADAADKWFFVADNAKRITFDPVNGRLGLGINAATPLAGSLHMEGDRTLPSLFNSNLRIIQRSASSPAHAGISLISYPVGNNQNGVCLYGISGSGGLNVGDTIGLSFEPVNAAAFNVSSDRRLKKDIQPIHAAQYEMYLQQIRAIESATYYYNNETKAERKTPHIGFIAQTLPAAVQTEIDLYPDGRTNEKRSGYNLSDFAGLSLVGLKALDEKAQQLEKTIAMLSNTIRELQKKIALLEKK